MVSATVGSAVGKRSESSECELLRWEGVHCQIACMQLTRGRVHLRNTHVCITFIRGA